MTKLMKKSLFLILTLLVLLAVGSVAAYAVAYDENGFSEDGSYQPAEAENGVYQIKNAGQLYWFAGLVNGDKSIIGEDTQQNAAACAVLTKDIVLNPGTFDKDGNYTPKESEPPELWTPIGDGSVTEGSSTVNGFPYTGTFDGDGHTISGLYVASAANYVGLFGGVGSGGTVKNLGVVDSYIIGSRSLRVGGVCGNNDGGTITNCYNTGTVSGSGSDNLRVGGVCGNNNGGTISNCYNTGEVSGSLCYVGGVCGYNSASITNCYNTGEVIGSGSYVGGVCGHNSASITNCYNTGEVSGRAAGGVCGYNGYNYASITNCYNTGAVSGSVYVGGVCGWNYVGIITNCYNTGEVSGSGSNSDVGGVCGWNDMESTIENCYNTGKVSGSDSYVGGVCGWNYGGIITNCYFLSETAGSGIGTNNGTATEVEEKTNDQFASGEVAWLLNGTSEGAWGHGSNNLPVLADNLPDGVTAEVPVCITIEKSDETTDEYGYTTAGSTLAAYPSGYVFFEDSGYTTWINTEAKTYAADTTIYAASPVTGITLDKTELSLYVKGTEQLTATIAPDTASKVLNWTSSNNTVATVDENGNVTALKAGTATITATAVGSSDKTATCTVTVKNRSGIVPQKTLTFDTNGGSEINSVTENYGKTIVLADYTPKRNGYKFIGWYKDKALTEKIEYAVLDYDMTVYAKWQKITETVEYDTLIVLTINDKTSIINGEAVKNDVAPLIVNSRTYTPARFVAESLGAKVVWDEKTKTVTITKDDVKIILVIDSTTAYVNGTKVQMDASAFIADGRTFTPSRFVAEQLGASVEWDEEARKVTIAK